MSRMIYSLFLYLATPWIFFRLWWRGRRFPVFRQRWKERLGIFKAPKPQGIWIHSVSLGESIAATPLIKKLQKNYPRLPLTITTTTPAGSEWVQKTFGDSVFHVYLPYDWPHAVKRFLNQIQPRLGIIMETELWPNLLHACQSAKLPILLANARLSPRSTRGYRYIKPIMNKMWQGITAIAANHYQDAKNFLALGFPAKKMSVVGNIKYDLEIPDTVLEKSKEVRKQLGWHKKIWIAASTHPPEHTIILDTFKILKNDFPDLLLLWVPRHLENVEPMMAQSEKSGWHTVKRSQLIASAIPAEPTIPTKAETLSLDIVIGDSIGELLLLYAASDIAFVGGSLFPQGGHNVLEPVALKIPVVSGPYIFNFSGINEQLKSVHGIRYADEAKSLAEAIKLLLENYQEKQHQIMAAHEIFMSNQGSITKHMQIIEKLLSNNDYIPTFPKSVLARDEINDATS